jgi:RNA polymerase sigma factor (sigma-70 family)
MTAAGQLSNPMTEERNPRVSRIVRDAGRKLLRFVRARVASDSEAEDVLQEVWQQLIRSLEDGPIEHVGAWLYTVARNRIIDRYRRPKPASLDALAEGGEEAEFELPAPLLVDDRTPETEHLRLRFWEELHAALAELPQEQRQVFVWHELEGLPFEEIVALTGENRNTLVSRKRYAVLHLRRRLEALWEEFLP